MEIISAREFRANQTAVLTKAKKGESVLLSSRIGMFKIMPVTEEDTLTTRICEGLREVKMIREGKLKAKSAKDFLNEL
jgi:antitoxin (DNA-binding transcriptional repressor) of toxin-antitoxin stability system